MAISYSRIGRVDWARQTREKCERSNMIAIVLRHALSGLFWLGMLTSSAAMAQVPSVPIDGTQINFGIVVFVTCLIGAIGFTWAAAAAWFSLRAEVRELRKEVRRGRQTRCDEDECERE